MINRLAQLKHFAYMIQMKKDVALHVTQKEETAFKAGVKHMAEDISFHADALMELIEEIEKGHEKEIFMEEDVDLSGGEEIA